MTIDNPVWRSRLANLIESSLEERSWSKEDLAGRIPVTRGAVYNWLKGNVPSVDMCFKIARALDMNPLRVLESCNYAPGVSGLLDLVEQLQAHQGELLQICTRWAPTRSQSGLGLVVDEFAREGDFRFRVEPWWRGTGQDRRHYADLLIIDGRREGGPLSQEIIEEKFGEVIALTMGWWEGPENWSHALSGLPKPEREDLVLNIPRFVANRRSTGKTDLRVPTSIVLIGGHWCGQAESGRFLAEMLDYDYALPSLAASVMHKTLAQRWNDPTWDRDRLDLVRTFSLSTPITRRRIWAVDYWDDAESVNVVTRAPNVPFVVFLDPSDALMEYAADRRKQDGHARGGRSRLEDLQLIKRVCNDARRYLDSVRADQVLVVPVDVIDEAWSEQATGRIALPLLDEWLDKFADTARKIYDQLPTH